MEKRGSVTQVEIFGQTYSVRAEGESSYVHDLARFVDSRMKEVAEQTATVDTTKIAILAAAYRFAMVMRDTAMVALFAPVSPKNRCGGGERASGTTNGGNQGLRVIKVYLFLGKRSGRAKLRTTVSSRINYLALVNLKPGPMQDVRVCRAMIQTRSI